MESVIRAAAMYFFLLVMFRVSGKRSLKDAGPFDLVLLLVISELTQEAMIDGDHSMTNAFILIATFVGIEIALSWLKVRFDGLERLIEDRPLVIVDHGVPLKDRMMKERIDEHDVLSVARSSRGIERLEQIKFAVLESSGEISVVGHDTGR